MLVETSLFSCWVVHTLKLFVDGDGSVSLCQSFVSFESVTREVWASSSDTSDNVPDVLLSFTFFYSRFRKKLLKKKIRDLIKLFVWTLMHKLFRKELFIWHKRVLFERPTSSFSFSSNRSVFKGWSYHNNLLCFPPTSGCHNQLLLDFMQRIQHQLLWWIAVPTTKMAFLGSCMFCESLAKV